MNKVSSSNGIKEFVPILRFPDFTVNWQEIILGNFTERVTRKNKNNESKVPLTISSKDGLINQNDFFNKQVASKDMSNYYLLKKGEFAYNKSYSVGYDYGSIKRLELYDDGALSTLYICFSIKEINSDFLKHYFDSDKWYKQIYMVSAEGARNHGLLNVSTDDFFNTKHYITNNTSEQIKIAHFLNLINNKIEKQEQLVNNLKKYKRGLIDKVFLSNKDNWNSITLCEILEIQRGGSPRPINEYITNDEDGLNWIKIGDTSIDSIYITSTKEKIKIDGLSKTRRVQKGDLILSNSMSYGRPYILKIDGCIHDGWLSISDPNNFFDTLFLYYLLSSEMVLQQYKKFVAGSCVQNLNKEIVGSVKIIYPSKATQIKLSKLFFNLDLRVKNENNILDNLKNQKKALLQQMFI